MATRLTEEVNANDHVQGLEDAPVTLVEYGDFECPHCGQAHAVVKRLQARMGDRLRFVYRHFPLPQHPHAMTAAETSEFAASEDRFWEMHDLLFRDQADMDDDLFPALAEEIGLDADALELALDDEEFAEHVEHDAETGEASGVHGTPTFFINGKKHVGGFDLDTMIAAIEQVTGATE